MTYRGRVENGVVVLKPGAKLREGTDVRVEAIEVEDGDALNPEHVRQLRDGLLSFSGIIKGGPSDLARTHDHYWRGTC